MGPVEVNKRKANEDTMEMIPSKELQEMREIIRQFKKSKMVPMVRSMEIDRDCAREDYCGCGKDPCECFVNHLELDEEA